ncbi:uncharacterized protein LOC123706305 [Colias croceus]|uniref:uncharacterized protein LOC123706305 n=1 Tax=Colias crocea TaxID=72248 RepID=UPI001E27DCAB|nr:uncharacterized protein LOC123706305 [Colias croceus]
MTVFAKPLDMCEKPIIVNNSPYVRGSSRSESRVDLPGEDYQMPSLTQSVKGVMYLVLSVIILLTLGVTSIIVMLRQYKSGYNNYQAFCHIPVPRDFTERMSEGKFRSLPIVWSSKPVLQVVSTMDEPDSDEFMDMLDEELDIGTSVEKISVVDHGRRFQFVHDFADNITGIVDDDRCFIFDMEPDFVLPPELLITGLTGGEQFDISKVRTRLRAALPAVVDISNTTESLAEACFSRPTYRVYRADNEDGYAIEKRSTDQQPHDYIQFSGKHVQEIKIDNIAEILQYEQSIKKI